VATYLLLPQGTHNLDELVYLNQAEAIRHGRLTYDADTYVPDFRPYLTGVAGDRVVFKYQPLWPAWLALSEAATGDDRPGLVISAMAAAAAFWLLGRELTGSAWLGTWPATRPRSAGRDGWWCRSSPPSATTNTASTGTSTSTGRSGPRSS
jgi:hypothetical protein